MEDTTLNVALKGLREAVVREHPDDEVLLVVNIEKGSVLTMNRVARKEPAADGRTYKYAVNILKVSENVEGLVRGVRIEVPDAVQCLARVLVYADANAGDKGNTFYIALREAVLAHLVEHERFRLHALLAKVPAEKTGYLMTADGKHLFCAFYEDEITKEDHAFAYFVDFVQAEVDVTLFEACVRDAEL